MDRRTDVKGLRKTERWLFAFPLLFCLSAACVPGTAGAQSPIINDRPEFGNKSAVYYQQAPAPIRLRSLEETAPAGETAAAEETQLVDIVIPQTPPITLNRRNISVTFPGTAYDAGTVVSKGLLYSDDKGGNWHEYGPMRSVGDNDTFPFDAPRDGEYYFALHLIHRDGAHTASRAQKYVIDTGSGIAAAASAGDGGDRMVQGLLSLTQKNESVQQTSAGGDALTSRLNENGAAPDPYAPSKNEIADVPYPGKINRIQRGTSPNGKPALSIIWFPPYQCGMSQSAGKVTIERAPTPEGPWTPVSESSSNLDINGSGYWFEAGDNDVDQFYLRTVSSVKNGEGEEQWIDTLSQPLSFSTPAAGGNTAVAQNSGAAGSGEIKAWSESEPAGEQKVAGRDTHDSVVDKTASVNSSAQSSGSFDAAGQAQRESQQAGRPQLTDPHQLSVNPIFRYGFGVFTGKDRSGNRLPDYSNAGNSPAYANQQNPQQKQELELPPPLPPRPIWMTKQEYEEHQRAYEMEVQQIRYAQAQREAYERQQKAMQNTAQGWNPNGQQATVTDQSGNEFRISEGSVLYQDEKGNLSATPFAGQFGNAPLPEMTFPDQPFNGQFQNVSQPMPVDGAYMQPIPNNGASFGDPYTQQEQTISQNAAMNPYDQANMSALPNQSIIQENLPPRPGEQQ